MKHKTRWPDASELGIEVGARWAYRIGKSSASADVSEVEVIRIGTTRPARVLVQLIDDLHEGRREWVAPVRLVAHWVDSDAWVRRQRQWATVTSASSAADRVEKLAAREVFAAVDPHEEWIAFAESGNRSGVLVVNDLSRLDGLCQTALFATDAGFWDGSRYVAPWPAAMGIARIISRQRGVTVVRAVRQADDLYRTSSVAANDGAVPELDGLSVRDYYDSLRVGCALAIDWCDASVVLEQDELSQLRAEIRRLTEQSRRLVRTLHDAVVVPITERRFRAVARAVNVDPRDLALMSPLP